MQLKTIKEYAAALTQCSKSKAISEGRLVHQEITRSEYRDHLLLKDLLVQMYARCGDLETAAAVFEELTQPSFSTWNSMINAYGQSGGIQEAKEIFERHPQPDVVSWTALLTSYAQHGHLRHAQRLFGLMPCWNIVSWNAMISTHATEGNLEEARSLFNQLPEANAVSWTTLASAYARKGQLANARVLFDRMPQRDVVAWTSMVTAYGDGGCVKDAKCVFERMCLWDSVSWNAMLHAYALNGYLNDAKLLFDQMPWRGVIAWNTMLQAHAQWGESHLAKALFDGMKKRNEVTWNTLIQAYARFGHMSAARCLLVKMPRQDVITWTCIIQSLVQQGEFEEARALFSQMSYWDSVAWNAMISGYAQNGQPNEALKLFRCMIIEGVFPTDSTFSSVLDACATVSSLVTGRHIHGLIPDSCLASMVVQTSLMNMYSKCGRLKDARSVFDQMTEQDQPCWNAMISAYARNGQGKMSIDLFEDMKLSGLEPDETTFMSVISACSHGGLVKKGYGYFSSMLQDYRIVPDEEHFRAFLDLLGRSGRLNEAEDLINNMPFWPACVAWTTLLGACKGHGEVERVDRLSKCALELAPDHPLAYVLLSNTHKQK